MLEESAKTGNDAESWTAKLARRMHQEERSGISVATATWLSLTTAAATVVFQVLSARPEVRLSVGIAGVVALGAAGQVLRGIGEQRKSPSWKAAGYYCGALAYGVTATVALVNGLPRLMS